jgi:hypothetical protein
VSASGDEPLAYQWRKDGIFLNGGTGSMFAASSAGTYSVVVTNAVGSVTSNSVMVTAAPIAPGIVTQPVGGTLPLGGTWMLSVSASGDEPLAYQWRKDGIVLNGGTGSMFAASSAGTYSVVVTNAVGSVTSHSVMVTAAPIAPEIISQPVGKNLSAGESIILTATATGTAPLSYQWIKNGVTIQGATQATFVPKETGSYSVIISNTAGTVSSLSAYVRVPPAVTPYGSEYEGLLTPSSSARMDVAGTVSVFISRSGTVSGKIRSRSGVARFIGRINSYGQIIFTPHSDYWLPLKNASDRESCIALEIISTSTGNYLSGRVSSSTGNAAEIVATLSSGPVKSTYTPQRSKYTALFQNRENTETTHPEGDGYAFLILNPTGAVLAGKLADGSRVTAFFKISEDFNAPLFIPLYNGKGLIMGSLAFDYSQPKTDVTCFGMRWFKPVGISFPLNYSQGWPGGISVDFVASLYDRQKALGDSISVGADLNFSASGGKLDRQAFGKAKFLPSSSFWVSQPSSINLTVCFDRSTGALSGAFTPLGATRPVMFSGVVLQKANFASGFFLLQGESGVVQLGP